jgi:hypothetical protein
VTGEHVAGLRRLQTGGRDHVHRVQGVRGRVLGMERLSVPPEDLQQHLPDDAGHLVELLEPDSVRREHRRRWDLQPVRGADNVVALFGRAEFVQVVFELLRDGVVVLLRMQQVLGRALEGFLMFWERSVGDQTKRDEEPAHALGVLPIFLNPLQA